MELINYKKVTLVGTLKDMPISNDQCLKLDISRKGSAVRTISRLKPDYKFTTKSIGSDFYIWRTK